MNLGKICVIISCSHIHVFTNMQTTLSIHIFLDTLKVENLDIPLLLIHGHQIRWATFVGAQRDRYTNVDEIHLIVI